MEAFIDKQRSIQLEKRFRTTRRNYSNIFPVNKIQAQIPLQQIFLQKFKQLKDVLQINIIAKNTLGIYEVTQKIKHLMTPPETSSEIPVVEFFSVDFLFDFFSILNNKELFNFKDLLKSILFILSNAASEHLNEANGMTSYNLHEIATYVLHGNDLESQEYIICIYGNLVSSSEFLVSELLKTNVIPSIFQFFESHFHLLQMINICGFFMENLFRSSAKETALVF